MDVRKYEALTMQDAVKLIKKELGRDAVILATREKETMLPGQNTRTKIVEVVAAAASSSATGATSSHVQQRNDSAQKVEFPRIQKEPDMKIVRGSPIMNALRPETRERIAQSAMQTNSKIQGTINSQAGTNNQANVNNQAAALFQNASSTKTLLHGNAQSTSFSQSSVQSQISSNLQLQQRNQNAPVAQVAPQKVPQIEEIAELRYELERMRRDMGSMPSLNVSSEVQEIKVLLHDLMKTKSTTDDKKYPEYLTNIIIKMRAAGVMESVLTDLMDSVYSLPLPKNPDGKEIASEKLKEFYLNNLIRQMFRNIAIAPAFTSTGAGPAIHCLVGPTGVGKTTTIAKLAAKLKIEQNKRIAFATMDTFRISAADQLRTYAKILDVPFQSVSDPCELLPFVEQNRECDFIFIDTAGRVARDTPHIESLKNLKDVELPLHFHLALSSTMKQRDIDETIRSFRFLAPESLIFTKLDESWNYGAGKHAKQAV